MAELPMKREAAQSTEDRSVGSNENQHKKLKTTKDSSASEETAFFEASVLQHINDDEEWNLFAKLSHLKEGRYFLKTKFHEEFVQCLKDLRLIRNDWIRISGIEGLGMSSSALYYSLKCRRMNDLGVYYVDLNEIEERDKNLESFHTYCKKFQEKACLIIDHVTLYNDHYLENMKKMVCRQVEDAKFILIETGFTANTSHLHCNVFGKKYQLDEHTFLNIWKGSVEYLFFQKEKDEKNYSRCSSLKENGKEVYDKFCKEYIMTPKLLNDVLEDMFIGHGRTVEEAFSRYTQKRRESIMNFRDCVDNGELARFILHTKLLLRYTPHDGQEIVTEEYARHSLTGINIFETEHCQVTEEDEYYPTMCKLGLGDGDSCVKVRHLVPILAKDWQERFPCNLEKMLEKANTKPVMSDSAREILEIFKQRPCTKHAKDN